MYHIIIGNGQRKTAASKIKPNEHFMRGLTELSEHESLNKLTQWLIGNLVATTMA
jgi:hypothetical protein